MANWKRWISDKLSPILNSLCHKIKLKMGLDKIVKGVIIEDPAITSPNGLALNFQPLPIQPIFKGSSVKVENWEFFKGILLQIHFSTDETHSVEGSGVIVAPGIALCAKHVIEPHLNGIQKKSDATICTAITSDGLAIWRIVKITLVPKSDLVILGLVSASELPPSNTFYRAAISTRLPKIGEILTIVGFRADEKDFKRHDKNLEVTGQVYACKGEVTERYPAQRDSSMAPWPTLEVNCPSWGGMSGGPVFNSEGLLIGLLSSSLNDPPSFVCLIWPSLIVKFEGGWPSAFFPGKKNLLEMDPRLCTIDDRAAITITPNPHTGGETAKYKWE